MISQDQLLSKAVGGNLLGFPKKKFNYLYAEVTESDP